MRITEAIKISENEINATLSKITQLNSLDELKKLNPKAIIRTEFVGDPDFEDIKVMVYTGNEKLLGIFAKHSNGEKTLIETQDFNSIYINQNNHIEINLNRVPYKFFHISDGIDYMKRLAVVNGAGL